LERNTTFLQGKDFSFSTCLKQIFLGTIKVGGHKKLGSTVPESLPWLRACL